MAPIISPFLDPGTHSAAHNLGIVQLRRDHLIPAVLAPNGDSDYAEGKVENTRFGSFPHSTLVNQPWGTQVLASVVDTGSRGKSKKRKREGKDEDGAETPTTTDAAETTTTTTTNKKKDLVKAATASSGFAHLIPPTPETWTLSLPHRTQVVYTPDYSYILQRLRVRPGDHLIEAGAGSGSFTHAAVRCVYNGAPGMETTSYAAADAVVEDVDSPSKKQPKRIRHGGVYSFEYHEPRATQLHHEIVEHGLDPVVTVTHRDVYGSGFNLDDGTSPAADAVFLDLPAPWQALKHLTRTPPSAATLHAIEPTTTTTTTSATQPFVSPLNPRNAVRICTFSPCIEQVSKTVSALRSLGWLEIDMVEIQAKRLEVRRERVGLAEEGVRGGNASAASVDEAVQRLRDVEGRAAVFHGLQKEKQEEVVRRAEARKRAANSGAANSGAAATSTTEAATTAAHPTKDTKKDTTTLPPSKHDRLALAQKHAQTRPLYKQGRLVHRTEAELKTHTSYLVFAVLPRAWTEKDEERARRKYGGGR